jgi:hypothetical protein
MLQLLFDIGMSERDDKAGLNPLVAYVSRSVGRSSDPSTDIIQCFINNGHNYRLIHNDKLNALQILAIEGKKYPLEDLRWSEFEERMIDTGREEEFRELKIFDDEKQIDDFIKFSQVYAILSLACSEDDFAIIPELFDKLIKDRTSKFEDGKINSDLIKKIIDGEPINLTGDHKIEVFRASWTDHGGYFIIESNDENAPLRLSYCDGNSLNPDKNAPKRKYGESIFELSKNKIDQLENSGSSPIKKLKNQLRQMTEYSYDSETISFLYTQILATLAAKDNPNDIEHKILTKEQIRGNCALKSFNIVLRAVLSKIYPELVFEIGGKPAGSGYEIYKAFKKSLIDDARKDLGELSCDGNNRNFWEDDLSRFKEKIDNNDKVKNKNNNITIDADSNTGGAIDIKIDSSSIKVVDLELNNTRTPSLTNTTNNIELNGAQGGSTNTAKTISEAVSNQFLVNTAPEVGSSCCFPRGFLSFFPRGR